METTDMGQSGDWSPDMIRKAADLIRRSNPGGFCFCERACMLTKAECRKTQTRCRYRNGEVKPLSAWNHEPSPEWDVIDDAVAYAAMDAARRVKHTYARPPRPGDRALCGHPWTPDEASDVWRDVEMRPCEACEEGQS